MPIGRKRSFPREVRPPVAVLKPPKAAVGEPVNVLRELSSRSRAVSSFSPSCLFWRFFLFRCFACFSLSPSSIDTFVKRHINATKFTAIPRNVRGESTVKVFCRTWIVHPGCCDAVASWSSPFGETRAGHNYPLRHLVNNYLGRLATEISVCVQGRI